MVVTYFLQGVYYNMVCYNPGVKGHFDQNMCLLFFLIFLIFAYYSSTILNSFSHILFPKLCQHNLSRPNTQYQTNYYKPLIDAPDTDTVGMLQ